MTKGPYLFDEFLSSNLEESISPFLTKSSRHFGINLLLKAAILSAFFLLLAFIFSFTHPPLSYTFLILVYFLSGTKALIDTIEDIKKLEINIDVLMTLAAFLSVLIDSAIEGGLLLVLFALSGAMEDLVDRKSKAALYGLQEISPSFAHVVQENGTTYEKSIREISIGTLILIKPGDVVPLDGVIMKGSSFVNMIHLTGESQPISKQIGDELQAGSRNLDGSLTMKVTKTSAESTLSRIIKLIHSAQDAKPKVQKLLDKFSKIYATSIIGLSCLFILILPFILGIPFTGNEGAIYRGLAFLIAASPCAIIIATPTAYLSALSACAKKGVLLKGGVSLDAFSSCKAIAFDKTGTLTTGKLKCIDFKNIYGNDCSIEEALSIAATLETHANHPIAKAICQYASEKSILLHDIISFQAIAGHGVEGDVALKNCRHTAFIGRPDYVLSKSHLPQEAHQKLSTALKETTLPISILLVHNSLFLFVFSDELRKEVSHELVTLKNTLHLRLLMLTGDHEQSAKEVAKQSHIDEIYYDLRPEDKLKIVSDLAQKTCLAMIGDGINDAPALARATVGISMGQIGSDTAIDASDIVLLQDDLSLIRWTYKKAKATMAIVKQNLTLALGVILCATTPALLGLIPLWLAVVLHEGGTVIVGLNSLRLLRK